ncbi:MAG: acyltransferase, partial [Planctomycetota bacterium]
TSLFGLIGLARRVLSRPRPWVRYASDSAYWLYIAHLPLVIGGQFAFAYVPSHPILEFMLLTAATTLVLLASYQLCIRHTWLGLLLNGTRR